MKKSEKILIILAGATLLYLIFHKKSSKPALTPAEKEDLFLQAMGYRGGAPPPDSVLKDIQEKAAEAQDKIDLLGLREEYGQYMIQKNQEPATP